MVYKQRTKILISTSLIILICFIGLTVSGNHSIAALEAHDPNLFEPFTVKAEKEAEHYRELQRELTLAVEAYFREAIESGDIVGAGVSVVKGGSIILSRGFGKKNIKTGARVNDQTIFRLGSLSKGFAGVLAAHVKNEGKLDWEAKVSDFIPGFQLGDRENTEKITLAHILSHSSGAPYHSYTNLVEAGMSLSEIANRFKEVKPISDPGEIYSYQNALYALSGEVIHRATGQDITNALEDRFFKPLEMCSTFMDHNSLLQAGNIAVPHAKTRYGWRTRKIRDNYYNAVAAGGINASTADMGRWMRFLLGHNPEVMDRAALEEAFQPFIEIKGRSKYYQRWPGHVSSHYGFGWRIHTFAEGDLKQEKTMWHHGGSVNNFRNEIALYPDDDLGICVLMNNTTRFAQKVIPDLYRIVQEVYGVNENKSSLAENLAGL
jgi:beta-lactamase class C